MSKIIKRKYRKIRSDFKKELYESMKENHALAMLVIETYTAWKHRNHILKIWGMFRNPDYKAFQKDYSKNLMGQHLTGSIDIWRSFHFAKYENLTDYKYKIPEKYAMGDALGMAYKVLKGN
ncbi:hypothetical protein [Gracilibacillus sp. YIM 98692]|uniref:hypothetical protein n=1 Tax=Gracilibacillus sp. YIM 98692 TaxID=2663532 RepID=UPI0013D05826|nr:hypothetical protein [Gracilibacillus sp. YIM 98692]